MELFALKTYDGTTIKVVAINEDAESHEKLMSDDNIMLSWNDINGSELPAGAYITGDSGEKYRLLDPYIPEQVNESEWRYNPTFSSRIAAWSKVPLFFYTRNASGAVVSREPDWSLTDTAENFIKYIARAISEETGETWTGIAAADLTGVQNVQFQSTDITSGLNSVANVFETEWRADKSTNTLYLGKAMFTGATTPTLEVGVNINVPAVTENKDGYYNRFVVFGSTRNITQDYEGANVNNLVNKRLTLNPTIFPNSVIDRRQSSNEPALTKILIFDDIYPKSNLIVIEARPRLMYVIKEGTTDEKIQIGTDAEGNPIYDQYAIWYLQLGTKAANGSVTPFRLANKQTYSKDNPDGVLIAGKNLSVHFSSGALNGREFELIYHDAAESVETSDGIPFEVKDGDFEIVYTKDNNFIVPSMAGIVPNVDDKAILFNLRMPAEYLAGAYLELKEAADTAIAEYESDRNNYEFTSNPVVFNGNAALLGLRVGQKVIYKNGDYSYETRILSITRKLDSPCEQTIKVGNDRIKGSTQTLKEDVANASKDITLIASFNQLTQSTINNYNKMLAEMTAGFDRIKNMWRFHPEHPNVIFTEYTVLAYGDIQSKKYSEIEGGSASAIELLTQWSDYTVADKDWLGLSAGLGVELHNRLTVVEGLVAGGLSVDLTGYATQDWVNSQGFLKSVAWDDVSGKPTWIGATKPSYAFSELTSHPTTLAGYGITDAYTKTETDGRFLGVGATAAAASKLADNNTYKAWGQIFFENGVPKGVSGNLTGVGSIKMNSYLFFTVGNNTKGQYLVADANGGLSLSSHTNFSYNRNNIFVTHGGNVLIGTATDSGYKLDVNGTARVSQLKIGKFTLTPKDDYLELDGTLVALGDVQSKKYADVAGGGSGGGGDFSIMSSWNASLADDPDYVLSAKLGYELYTNMLSRGEAEGLYQPKGDYASASALGDYVTLNTAQTISNHKTFTGNINALGVLFFKAASREDGIYIVERSDSDKLQFAHHKNYAWQKNIATLDINGYFIANKFAIPGGTSAQFLKADGSVDSNTYLTSHQSLDYINVKDIRGTTPAPNTMSSKKVMAWFTNSDKPGPKAWYSGLTVQGWNSFENYAGWQIAANADVNADDLNLYFRVGVSSAWKSWQTILTDSNYASILDNSYVKKTGDTMTGVLNVDQISNQSGSAGLLGYKRLNTTSWFAGAGDTQGIIRSNATSLLHRRDGVDYTIWDSYNDGSGSGLDADLLDGLHGSDFYRVSTNMWNAGESVADFAKRCTIIGIHSLTDWAWANSANLTLGSYVIDRERYSCIDFRSGNLNNAWQQKALLFLPTYTDVSMVYIAQMTTSATAGAVSTSVKRYADYDTVLGSTVAAANKLATARNLAVSDYDGSHTGEAVAFDGTAAVTLKMPNIINCANLYSSGSIAASILRVGNSETYGHLFLTPASASGNASLRFGATSELANANSLVMSVDRDTRAVNFHRNVMLNSNSLYLSSSKRLWVDSSGVLRFNGTMLVDGDVQSKKASDVVGGDIVKTGKIYGPTYKVPTTASIIIMETIIDGDLTLTLDGSASDFDVIYLFVKEYSAGMVNLKYGNTAYEVWNGAFALVSIGGSVYFYKLS